MHTELGGRWYEKQEDFIGQKSWAKANSLRKAYLGSVMGKVFSAFGTVIKRRVISKTAAFLPARSVEVLAGDHLPSNKTQSSSFT